MRLAGDRWRSVEYLMGNHTIAQRMYRHDPAIVLYAPLRTAIYETRQGRTYFTWTNPAPGLPASTIPTSARSVSSWTANLPPCCARWTSRCRPPSPQGAYPTRSEQCLPAGAPVALRATGARPPRAASASRLGGTPNMGRYSRLNCEALSQPTAKPTPATSPGSAISRALASRRRICSAYVLGTQAVQGREG
jgi:Domain of unknown function DUF302